MSETMLFAFIFCGVWCGVGLIFLLIGILIGRIHASKVKRCSACTIGTVGEIVQGYFKDENSWQRGYRPVFEYYVNGQMYRCISKTMVNRIKLISGQSVTVYYNPEKPQQYYVKEYTYSNVVGKVFVAVGLGIMIISAIVFYCCYKLS